MNHIPRTLVVFLAVMVVAWLPAHAGNEPAPPVEVILDMDPSQPGIQSSIELPACSTVEHTVAVYIRDPIGERMVWSIGLLAAIDRSIALGHTPDETNEGAVTGMTGAAVTPVNPGNTAWVTPGYIPAFAGPELHYLEHGAKEPAVIPATPSSPVFSATIVLDQPKPGDAFRFYLLDYVSVWSGGDGGAFSVTASFNSMDCGGDLIADQTETELGIDPDQSIPSPPAPYLVDFIDGPIAGGGAMINIVPSVGDVTADGSVGVEDLLAVINAWGRCDVSGECPADIVPPGGDGVVDVSDLLAVINHWSDC